MAGVPALSNDCAAWVGFYTEFDVDYGKFINRTNNETYTASGGDMKVCFKNTTVLNATDVFVTDLLSNVTVWPTPPTVGPTTPPETNVTLYNSTNGFTTTLEEGDDVNT